MPPIEPPITAAHRSIPRASASAASTVTWSRMVIDGNRDPHGDPSGDGEAGPVVPWQPPRVLGQITHHRSVSMAAPGPMRGSHQPGVTMAGSGRAGGVAVPGQGMLDRAPRCRGVGDRRPHVS